jgi:hypothetical protein
MQQAIGQGHFLLTCQTPDKTPRIVGIDPDAPSMDMSFLVMTSSEVNWITTKKTWESMLDGKKLTAEKDSTLLKSMVKNMDKMKESTKKIQNMIDLKREKEENAKRAQKQLEADLELAKKIKDYDDAVLEKQQEMNDLAEQIEMAKLKIKNFDKKDQIIHDMAVSEEAKKMLKGLVKNVDNAEVKMILEKGLQKRIHAEIGVTLAYTLNQSTSKILKEEATKKKKEKAMLLKEKGKKEKGKGKMIVVLKAKAMKKKK